MTQDAPAVAAPAAAFHRRLWSRLRPVLARTAKAAIHGVERMVHPWRRKTAIRRIREMMPVRDVLVLCYGNICRSPYAAAAIAAALERRHIKATVRQGGFFGPGRPANERAMQVARSRGTELLNHTSRLVTADDAKITDLVVVMEQWHADRVVQECGAHPTRTLLLGDLDPATIESRAIPDPYGHEVAVFTATFDRIDRCAAALAEALTDSTTPYSSHGTPGK